MANLKYEIVIRDQTNNAESTPVSVDSAAGASGTDNKAPKEKDKDAQGSLASTLVSVGAIKPYVQQAIGFMVSSVEMRTGSAELQRKATLLSSVGASAVTIITDAVTRGPKAAAITAGIMAVQSVFEHSIKQDANRLQAIIESENLALRRSRLGMSTNHSRFGGTI